jgi:hypothetical protein
MPRKSQPAAIRWVSLAQLASETGFSERMLQYIRTQEPGCLTTRQQGQRIEYQQPDCAVALRQRERKDAEAKARPSNLAESEQRKAAADAEMAEVRLAKLRGELAPRAEFAAAFERLFGAVRQELQALPTRHGPRVVGLTQPAEAVAALREMVADVLAGLSSAVDAVEEPADEPEEEAA